MPEKFDACMKGGGRVRTKELSGGRYMHICFPKGGGSSVAGEVKTKQEKPGGAFVEPMMKKKQMMMKEKEMM